MAAFTLWQGGPIYDSGVAFPLGTDSVLLSDFARTAGVKRGCELCCGSGAISLMLLWTVRRLHMDCVELLPEAAEVTRANLNNNSLEDRSTVINGDIRSIRELIPAGSHELVVCNPPYFPEGSGKAPSDRERRLARTEAGCTIADVCSAAAWLLKPGGTFSVVFRPERLSELLCVMSAAGLEPKRLRCVSHTAEKAPCLVLVEGKRGARAGLSFLAPLILKDDDGGESAEFKRIYHKEDE